MALAAPGGLFTEQGAAGRRVAAKQPEHRGKPAPESRGCGQVSRTHHPPFGDRGSAGGSEWDGEWAGKGRAGAAAVPGAAGVNPEEPISCPHQGTQAQPSATERGYFGSWQEVKSQGLCSRSEGSVGLWGPGGWEVTVAPARWAVRTRWLPHLPNMGEPPPGHCTEKNLRALLLGRSLGEHMALSPSVPNLRTAILGPWQELTQKIPP